MSKEFTIFIDHAPSEDCVNPDSYGEVCVQCNQCGRFDEDKDEKKKERKDADRAGSDSHRE